MSSSENEIQKEKDPIICCLVVKESLNMSIGKTCSQTSHATQLIIQAFWDEEKRLGDLDVAKWAGEGIGKDPLSKFSAEQWLRFLDWTPHDKMTKIVLSADDKEFEKVKKEIPEHERFVVVDAGHTELLLGTETVIGVIPMRKSQRPKILKRLQVLK